ncbi:hypothetical protein SCARD494_07496 [Seiridium cardinale]
MQLKATLTLLSLVSASIGAPQPDSISTSRSRKPCKTVLTSSTSVTFSTSRAGTSQGYNTSPTSGSSSIGSGTSSSSVSPSAGVSSSSSVISSSSVSSSTTYGASSSSASSSTGNDASTSSSVLSNSSSAVESSSTTVTIGPSDTSSTVSATTSDTSSSAVPGSSSTTISSTTSDSASTSTDYPVPTPGVEMPTHTYTGGISSFSTGTAVSVQNPSFEDSDSASTGAGDSQRRRAKRQSTAQVAAAAEGWTIQSCGSGDSADCQFENYDAADGVWAFSGKNGGLLYQDGVNLAAGGSYAFTWYWKVVSTFDGATSSSTGNQMTQALLLGSSANPDVTNSFVPTLGSATVESGADWAQQTFTVSKLDCQYARFATDVRSDGSLDFRMFLQGKTASGTIGDFLWYVDEIRVQQLAPPSGGTLSYLTNTCKITPPASTTTSATSTYTVTQTYAATATPTAGTNALANPSFESTSITETTDVNGFPVKATSWTSTGCAGRQCQLYTSGSSSVTCQDGTRCEYWRAPTTYSQTIGVTIGATYFLSIWTFLGNIPSPSKSGSSAFMLTVEPAGATPGSGGLVLLAENADITSEFLQSTGMLDLNADFAENLCGAAAADTTATCQFTISAAYTGTWDATDNLLNYFDNVSFLNIS